MVLCQADAYFRAALQAANREFRKRHDGSTSSAGISDVYLSREERLKEAPDLTNRMTPALFTLLKEEIALLREGLQCREAGQGFHPEAQSTRLPANLVAPLYTFSLCFVNSIRTKHAGKREFRPQPVIANKGVEHLWEAFSGYHR